MNKNYITQRLIALFITCLLAGCFMPVPIPIPVPSTGNRPAATSDQPTQTVDQPPPSQPLLEKVVGEWDVKQGKLDGRRLAFYKDGTAVAFPAPEARHLDHYVTEYKVLDEKRIAFTEFFSDRNAVVAEYSSPQPGLLLLAVSEEDNPPTTYVLENRRDVSAPPTGNVQDLLLGSWYFGEPGVPESRIIEILDDQQLIIANFEDGLFMGGGRVSYQFVGDKQIQSDFSLLYGPSSSLTSNIIMPERDTLILQNPEFLSTGLLGRRHASLSLQPKNLSKTIIGLWKHSWRNGAGGTYEFFEDGTLIITLPDGQIYLEKFLVISEDSIEMSEAGPMGEFFVVQLPEDRLGITAKDYDGSAQLERVSQVD